MMSGAKKRVPKRRFKEFLSAGDWKQRKLSDISTKVTTKNVDVHYTETLTNSAEQGIISQVDFFDKEISNKNNINGYYIVENNDFIYNPRISTLAPVGPINRNKLNRTGIMSPLYTVFRASNIDLDFLEWYFQSNHWYRYMKLNGDSGARADRIAIKDSTFFDMPIKTPVNIKEQVLIGETLEKFNQYITLHQRKLDKLQATKKALLQEMFPEEGQDKPKRRFKGFTDAWEQRKLGEIADITKLAGFEFTKYIVYSDKGNIIALRGLNIKDGDLNLDDIKYIDSSDFTKLKRSKLFRNDILFTYVGTIGEVARIQEDDKYYLAPNVSRIRIKNRLLSEFLMYYMDRDLFYQKIIFPLIATSSQPALSMANIREFNITYPSDTNEQQKIALVFNRISHLITLHQRKLDKLKNLKQAYLNEMFV